MATITKSKLQDVLTTHMRLKDPEFLLERVGNRLVGNIISVTFRGKRDHQRQNMIWDAVEAGFGAEGLKKVGMLLAYTPEEWNVDTEDQAAPRRKKKAG